MNILHVVSGMDPKDGGVTSAISNMVAGLEQNGISSKIVSLDDPGSDFINNVENIHGLGPSRTAWRYSSLLKPWLKDHLYGFDAVIVHGLWQYHVYAVYSIWRSMRLKRPKLLVMPHGMLDPYFQQAKGRKFKALRNSAFWKFVEGRLVNNADCILFTCETERILAAKPFRPYRPLRTEVVGLGINEPPAVRSEMLDAFRSKCGNVDASGGFLFISRIHPKKGVDMLIDEYQRMEKQNQNLPKLVIAGPGLDTDFGKEMKEKASGSQNIIFTGMLLGDEKWGAYYSSCAMILPSHQENFGFVVAESVACGKPVLISNQVNTWREIEHAGAGIVRDDTIKGTGELISAWINLSGSSKIEMSEKARLSYKSYFSLHAASEALTAVLKQLCSA